MHKQHFGNVVNAVLNASVSKQELLLFLQTTLQNRHLKDLLMPLTNPLQQLNKRFMSSSKPLRIPMKMKNTSLLHKMKMMRKVINDGAGDDEGVEPVGGAEQQVHDPDG